MKGSIFIIVVFDGKSWRNKPFSLTLNSSLSRLFSPDSPLLFLLTLWHPTFFCFHLSLVIFFPLIDVLLLFLLYFKNILLSLLFLSLIVVIPFNPILFSSLLLSLPQTLLLYFSNTLLLSFLCLLFFGFGFLLSLFLCILFFGFGFLLWLLHLVVYFLTKKDGSSDGQNADSKKSSCDNSPCCSEGLKSGKGTSCSHCTDTWLSSCSDRTACDSCCGEPSCSQTPSSGSKCGSGGSQSFAYILSNVGLVFFASFLLFIFFIILSALHWNWITKRQENYVQFTIENIILQEWRSETTY